MIVAVRPWPFEEGSLTKKWKPHTVIPLCPLSGTSGHCPSVFDPLANTDGWLLSTDFSLLKKMTLEWYAAMSMKTITLCPLLLLFSGEVENVTILRAKSSSQSEIRHAGRKTFSKKAHSIVIQEIYLQLDVQWAQKNQQEKQWSERMEVKEKEEKWDEGKRIQGEGQRIQEEQMDREVQVVSSSFVQ